jgi:predicted negative regulator of RcsB-dependent stress response
MEFSGKLQPGQSITQAEIEAATGQLETTDPQAFALLLLRLRGDLISHLKRIHGRELTVRIIKGDLLILDDRQAAAYNPKRYTQGLRIARRAHRRLMAVDVSKLTPQEREQHTQTVCRQASALSSLRARPEIPVAASTRPESPKLMAGKK